MRNAGFSEWVWLSLTYKALPHQRCHTANNASPELSSDILTAAQKNCVVQMRKGEYWTTDEIYMSMGQFQHTGEETPTVI